MTDSGQPVATAVDAATVVVVRDTSPGIEVLMLRKHSAIHFGGMWVFPGGRVDEDDHAEGDARMAAFRRAAVREALEEAGFALAADDLVHFAHWLPPPRRGKRFSTQFFLSAAPAGLADINIDGEEIVDHRWLTPVDALLARHRGELEFVTPTFVTLNWLRQFDSAAQALASIRGPQCFHTRTVKTAAGSVALYDGDVAYESLDPEQPGPRRRANMFDSGWWWEEHDGEGNGPWPAPLDF